jgi:ATP-dependent DNA helicase UvrD/PcrA
MPNLSSLNPQQRLAVETLAGPVLILAGAGTGKTRVITFRVAYMIERGIAPEHILGVTFTNKAAREMQERVSQLIPNKGRRAKLNGQTPAASGLSTPDSRPTICTFHSLCVRILRQHIEKLGYKRNFVIYDESEQLGAIRKILAQISANGEKSDPAAILGLLSRYRNGGDRAAIFADESVRAMAEHVRKRYESALRACNAVDFDDLILLTLRLFSEHPQALEACRARYRYVMVDEYQDTNAAQFQLVHLLTRDHRNLCVVGDDDQSIYGWRGAEISNLLDMEKHYPEVRVIKLEQNYRSTNTILRAANAIIRHNVRRRGKQLWSQKGDGPKILLSAFESDEEEARGIVEQIEYARLARRTPWADQAILFRINAQSRALETALRQATVRYRVIGGQSFFDRREVRDFLAYLKTFLNPHDDVSLLRIANTPARGLSDVTMERLLAASQERKCAVFAAMKNPVVTTTFQSRTRQSIEQFVEFIERTRDDLGTLGRPSTSIPPTPARSRGEKENGRHRGHDPEPRERSVRPSPDRPSPGSEGRGWSPSVPGHSLQAWADRFLEETGYFNELRRQEKNPEAAENRIRNLRELISSMDGVMVRRGADAAMESAADTLQRFLEDIALDTEREAEEDPGDAVTLITMHSCKGLEFPHVYVVGLEDGLLPHARSKTEGTLDEERRLFYVAITRAMRTLSISHCGGRRKYGQLLPCHPSPFLRELPPELVERADEKGKQPVNPQSGRNLFAVMREAVE